MPLVPQSFSQLIDFTRTSAATFVNSSGNIASTPQSRNLLTFTQEFANAYWSKTRSTITANTTTAPDGTSTADTLNEDSTASSTHPVSVAVTLAAAAHTLSLYVKASGRSWVQLNLLSTANAFANFNVATGALGTVGSAATATITSVGNGWYRCTMTATTGAGANTVAIYPTSADNTVSFTGTGIASLFIWGAQLEQASSATDYTRNVGGVFPPRFDYDPVTLAPRGLLIEEQRVNLALQSEAFDTGANWPPINISVTANASTSPSGAVNADRAVIVANSLYTYLRQIITVTASTTYTFTFWMNTTTSAAGNTIRIFNITGGTDIVAGQACVYSGGWVRQVCTFTTPVGCTSIAVYPVSLNAGGSSAGTYLDIWGAQLEAGSFATSYIPTVASQVTRAADVAAITGPNFTPWYNQSAGTFVVEGSVYSTGLSGNRKTLTAATEGNFNNSARTAVEGSSSGGGAVTVGGVSQAAFTTAGVSANTPFKLALAMQTNDFAFSLNGATALTDASGTMVSTSIMLNIGNGPQNSSGSTNTAGDFLNGHIRSIRFYPSRLSNAQIQALTA